MSEMKGKAESSIKRGKRKSAAAVQAVNALSAFFRRMDDALPSKHKQTFGESRLIEQDRAFILSEKHRDFYSREAYNTLRTNIHFSLADVEGCKTLIVTSAMQSEGKSITAANLALTLAETNSKVIIIDCDMRRPKTGRLLQMKSEAGLSNILMDPRLLKDNILRFRNSVDVILAGSIPPNPSELLGSARMRGLLTELKKTYDYIILDTPPVNIVTDAVALSPQADGVLFVVRVGQSERGMVTQAVEHLEYANAKILGFSLTCVPLEKTNYGYSKYRYKKYGRYGYKRGYGRYGYGEKGGYGEKSGYGYGYGEKSGYGYGYGYGEKSGYGYGYGYGSGYGSNGYGYGSGYGYGYGKSGYGYGKKSHGDKSEWRAAATTAKDDSTPAEDVKRETEEAPERKSRKRAVKPPESREE